jgi:hypothetical protein
MQPRSDTAQRPVIIDLTEEPESVGVAGNVRSPPLGHPRRPPSPSLFVSDDSDFSSLSSLSSIITSFGGRAGGHDNTRGNGTVKAKTKTPAVNSQSTAITNYFPPLSGK